MVIDPREREQIIKQHLIDNGERDIERIEQEREKRKFYVRIETDRACAIVQQKEGRHSLERARRRKACLIKRCIQ